MATMIPETLPNRAETEIPDSERKIFNLLKDGPGTSGWVVLHSVDVPGIHKKSNSREIDFLIMVPDGGIICLEVKGDSYDHKAGKWYRIHGTDGRTESVSPANQSKHAMDALKDHLAKIAPRSPKEKINKDNIKKLPIWYALAFTNARWPKDAPRRGDFLLCDYKVSQNQQKLCQELKDYAESLPTRGPGKLPLDLDTIDSIAKLLRPEITMDYVATSGADLQRIHSQLLKLTKEQFRALKMVQDDAGNIRNERVLFEGAAGTGKTMLAEQLAKLRTKARERVAILFPHPILAGWMKSQLPGVHAVGTFLDVMIEGSHVRDEFYREFEKASGDTDEQVKVAAFYAEMAAETMQKEGLQWDYLIVDELQYIDQEHHVLDSLDRALKGGLKQGRWAMFGDFTFQNWFTEMQQGLQTGEKMGPKLQFPVVNPKEYLKLLCPGTNGGKGWVEAPPLEFNCRNTRSIAQAATRVVGMDPPQVLLPSQVLGPPVDFYYWQDPTELDPLLEEEFWRLHEAGVKPEQVTVLSDVVGISTAHREKYGPWRIWDYWQTDTVRVPEREGRFNRDWVNMFPTIDFVGMESDVVIIVDNGDLDPHASKFSEKVEASIAYVNMTRAKGRLVVLAHESLRGFLEPGTQGIPKPESTEGGHRVSVLKR